MSRRLLGGTFDIHGGGLDLVFPHHENEIAQSECCHGQPMAKYWLHNGLMQASDEVGKVGGRQHPARRRRPRRPGGRQDQQVEGRQPLPRAAGPVRPGDDPLLPAVHPLSPAHRLQRGSGSARWRPAWRPSTASSSATSGSAARASTQIVRRGPTRARAISTRRAIRCLIDVAERRNRFLEAMDDDFNTGGAIGDLFELVRRLNKFVDDEKLEDPAAATPAKIAALRRGTATLRELAATLGLFRKPPRSRSRPPATP